MSGWFGQSAALTELDGQIERATSSSLEDIALNLEISDTVRSKTVPAVDCMRSLKRRISNKNPNVQLSALQLTDTCAKNGGAHFMQQLASREFMDNLVSLVRYDAGAPGEREVRQKILELIQSWTVAAQGREGLSYIGEVYRTLQNEGYTFPPKQEVASSMFDSSAPPEWSDSDVCMRCREKFTFTNRKHHCRNCGNVFCGNCSAKSLPLPHLGIMAPVRVDDGCYVKLQAKSSAGGRPQSSGGGGGGIRRTLWQESSLVRDTSNRMQPRSARAEDSFDADLKRALEMSLEDSKGHAGSGYVPASELAANKPPQQNGTAKSASKPEENDDDDPDLKAAIAASLQDMEEQKKRHAQELKAAQSAPTATTAAAARPNPQFELTPVEAENINLFATLVDRLQHQPPGTILREPQIQELYEAIGALRPKLARTYGETMSKHDTLLDLHSKLATVVRYYDRMLEERMANAYSSSRYGQPARQNALYPQLGAPSAPPTMNDAAAAGVMESYYTGQTTHTDSYRAAAPTAYGAYPPHPQHNSAPYPSFDQSQPQQQQMINSYGGPPPPEAAYYSSPQMSHQPQPQPQPPTNYAQQSQPTPYPQQQQPPQPQPSAPPTDHTQRQQPDPARRRPSQQTYSQPSSQYAPSHTSQSSNPPLSSPLASVAAAEGATNFYYGTESSAAAQASPQPSSPTEVYHHPPQQQQFPHLPHQEQQQTPLQQQPSAQQQQQHHQTTLPQQQQWPQVPTAGTGYGQESFPTAPQDAPIGVAVKEESLIEF